MFAPLLEINSFKCFFEHFSYINSAYLSIQSFPVILILSMLYPYFWWFLFNLILEYVCCEGGSRRCFIFDLIPFKTQSPTKSLFCSGYLPFVPFNPSVRFYSMTMNKCEYKTIWRIWTHFNVKIAPWIHLKSM